MKKCGNSLSATPVSFMGLFFLLSVTIILTPIPQVEGKGEGSEEGLKPHGPIIINSKEELEESSFIAGSGTEGDPFVIEGWKINVGGSEKELGIGVSNVQTHLLIKNCELVGGKKAGLLLKNVENVSVEKNAFLGNENGLLLESSKRVQVSKNTFKDNNYALSLFDCLYVTIGNNDVLENAFGIYLQSSTTNELTENLIKDNGWHGVYLDMTSRFNKIYHNSFVDNGGTAGACDGSGLNTWYEEGKGNYWSRYEGKDANGDRIGDSSYKVPGKEGNYDKYPLIESVEEVGRSG